MSEQEVSLDDFADSPDGEGGDQTWKQQQLRGLVKQLQAGGTPDTNKDEYYDGEISWVKTGELGQIKINSTEQTITEQGLDESTARLFPSKTVLIAMYGATTGEVSILDTEAATNQACCGIIPDDRIIPYYLYYQLVHGKSQLRSFSAGSGQQNISKSILEKYKIPVAPIEEQRKIATILYTVDQAIEKTEEIIKQATTLKSGVIQHVFTQGVEDHTSFAETKSGKIPSDWELEPLKNVIEDTRYGTDTKSNTKGDGYPTLRIPNVVEKRITLDDVKYTLLDQDELDRLELKEDDIIVIRTNGNPDYVGRCATFSERDKPFVFASYLIRIRVDEARVRPKYVREFLNSRRGRSEMAGWIRSSAGNYNLSVGSIEKFQIPIPSLEEQDKIIEQIESSEEIIDNNREYRDQLQRLKQGLMQDLLSGTVRTTDTNITVPDEVAQHG